MNSEEIIEHRRAKRRKLLEELKKSSANENQEHDESKKDDSVKTSKESNGKANTAGTTAVSDPIMNDDDSDDMFAGEEEKSADDLKKIKKGQELAANMLDDWDDHEGYYRVIIGELLDGRYEVTEVLGKGMFASVVRAEEIDSKIVAIKIIRNNESMKTAAYKEIDILQSLHSESSFIIRLLTTFEHKNHLCLVFENMEENLRDSLKRIGRDGGFSLQKVRNFARQSLKGLEQLQKCHIIHGDIKPDNILINESQNIIKIADLGSAQILTDEDELTTREAAPYMASRFYRAPELILGLMPYGYGVDMWSLGCSLYEMYTGKVLFPGSSNNDMLRIIMSIRGNFSRKFLSRCTLSEEHFNDELDFLQPHLDKIVGHSSIRPVRIPSSPPNPLRNKLKYYGNKVDELWSELDAFADILDKMLMLNPDKRLTVFKGLNHPFIIESEK